MFIGTSEALSPGYGNEEDIGNFSLDNVNDYWSKIKNKPFVFEQVNYQPSVHTFYGLDKQKEIEMEEEPQYQSVAIKKTAESEAEPIDVTGDGTEDTGTEDIGGEEAGLEGDMGGLEGGGDMGGGMGGEMGGQDGEMGGGQPPAPDIDYDSMFLEHTHDLEKFRDEADEIDFSRLT